MLKISNSDVELVAFTKTLYLRYLTQLQLDSCNVGYLCGYFGSLRPHIRLQALQVTNSQIDDDMANGLLGLFPFVQMVDFSHNIIKRFEYESLPYLIQLDLSKNQVVSVTAQMPQIYIIELSFNKLTDSSFLDSYPTLLEANLEGNPIQKLQFKALNHLYYLNIAGTQIYYKELAQLQGFRLLQTLVVPEYQNLTLKYIRECCLGSLLARQDEVTACVGKSQFVDKYEEASSFDQVSASAARLEAEGSIHWPRHTDRAAVIGLLKYVKFLNNQYVSDAEAVEIRNWLYPEYLAVYSVMVYE